MTMPASLSDCPSVARLTSDCDASLDALREQETRAREGAKQLAEDIVASVAAKGGVWQPPETTGEVLVNAGGVVFPVSRRGLLMPLMRKRYISVLLMHFADGMPKDPSGHVYLEVSSAYFDAFLDALTLYETGRANTVTLPANKAADPTYAEYHCLFMREVGVFSPSADQQQAPLDATMANNGAQQPWEATAGVDEATQQYFDASQPSIRAYVKAAKGLGRLKEDINAFLTAMEPFLKTPGDGDSTLLSLTILGRQVVILKSTLLRLGDKHPLLTRFSDTPPNWPDRHIRQTPAKHFVHTVEFARRIAMTMPKGQFIHPPLLDESERRLCIEDMEMYGIAYAPICHLAAGGDLIVDLPAGDGWVIQSAQEWVSVLVDIMDKPTCSPSLLFKSSRDGDDFGTMVDKVGDASGLLFLINHNDTHRFGAFVNGQLKPPADPTHTSGLYKVQQFLISISGAYGQVTKIPIPTARQTVHVAGRDAFIKSSNEDSRGKLCLGSGYLWFAWGSPGPADDVRSMNQWVKTQDLPDGYLGQFNSDGNGTLAGAWTFTAKEVEIWHVHGGGATSA
ncbi:unnamed protein product [Vitrella brassicaformis CCMP3155]|uniref:TLDc domain-containing protein n=2 Tax=Vitrella brassicaformis TaxID=1169539 RepID=A0A0G4FR67_VITBC|nr:unnamed protein product [Vitrella brassicaformis CCMP3155]|eukprot:CEM16998.1 unnamed protein product [Vitrella brassicaformis CCMP3155]